MTVCSCNIIMEREIRSVIAELLDRDPWQLIVPLQVYKEMGKRGKCCQCFPKVVDIIIDTTQQFHEARATDSQMIVQFISELKVKHEQCETARMLARHRLTKIKVA